MENELKTEPDFEFWAFYCGFMAPDDPPSGLFEVSHNDLFKHEDTMRAEAAYKMWKAGFGNGDN